MSIVRKDFFERLVEQFGNFLAAVVKQRKAGQAELALQQLEQGYLPLLGMDGTMLKAVDSHSAADLLDHPVRIASFARLLLEEAEIQVALGALISAERCRSHALEIYLEALSRTRAPSLQWITDVRTLREQVEVSSLAPHYRELLAAL